LTIHHEAAGTTMLTGPVRDQAALYGLLIKMRDLGLSLLLVRPVESEPPSPSATACRPSVQEDYHEDPNGHPSTRLDL
jgi:hypothetical protein